MCKFNSHHSLLFRFIFQETWQVDLLWTKSADVGKCPKNVVPQTTTMRFYPGTLSWKTTWKPTKRRVESRRFSARRDREKPELLFSPSCLHFLFCWLCRFFSSNSDLFVLHWSSFEQEYCSFTKEPEKRNNSRVIEWWINWGVKYWNTPGVSNRVDVGR